MITACLIATTANWGTSVPLTPPDLSKEAEDSDGEGEGDGGFESFDGPSEEEAYIQGEYKTILQLVGVLSHGRAAKRLADRAIDLMQDVQNLRKAIYDNKLKVDAAQKGSAKERKLRELTVNYLYVFFILHSSFFCRTISWNTDVIPTIPSRYRYGTLIVFANYLIEMQDKGGEVAEGQKNFPTWLAEHREIKKLLSRRSLD